jgi:hypothetical protein
VQQDRYSHSLLNIDVWADGLLVASPPVGGELAIRFLPDDIPLDCIACVEKIDVPPGTNHEDMAYLLIEQLLELADRTSDVIDRWRITRGSTQLMGRLRTRLRIELESLRMAYQMGLERNFGAAGSPGEAFMAERRRFANIPPETRSVMWRLRALWYGEWSV